MANKTRHTPMKLDSKVLLENSSATLAAGGNLEQAALGRPFDLGMLYDARSESLTNLSLWTKKQLEAWTERTDYEGSHLDIATRQNYEEKADALNVDTSLDVSVAYELFKLGLTCSAKYITSKKQSTREAHVALTYSCTSTVDQVTINDLTFTDDQRRLMKEGRATHVVTRIMYGADAVFDFEKKLSSTENKEDVEARMKLVIQYIPILSVAVKGDLKMSKQLKEDASYYRCTFFGDFVPQSLPSTFEEAVSLYKDMPKILKDVGKYKPIKVWLHPLQYFCDTAPKLVNTVSVSLASKLLRCQDQLQCSYTRCTDLRNLSKYLPHLGLELHRFQSVIQDYITIIKRNVAKLLPAFRSGDIDEKKLDDIYPTYEKSPFNQTDLGGALDYIERYLIDVNAYIDQLKAVQLRVLDKEELEKLLANMKEYYVFCLEFQVPKTDTYLAKLQDYIAPEKTHESNTGLSKNVDKMMEVVKEFKSYALSKDIPYHTNFVMTESVRACYGCDIAIYKEGALTNLVLPSKPRKIQFGKNEAGGWRLQWEEPECGSTSVLKYEGDIINVKDDKNFRFKEDATYYDVLESVEFTPFPQGRVRAISKMGPGPYSDWAN